MNPDVPFSTSVPEPAPRFPALVVLHLRSLAREFPVAWILFGGLALLLPVVAMLSPTTGGDPLAGQASPELLRVMALLSTLTGLTVLVAFLWPEAVWRNLPPGGRGVMDAFPVSRRMHRMARITAGGVIPLVMALSVGLTGTFLRARPELAELFDRFTSMPEGAAAGVTFLSLLAAYAFGSAIALRVGKVFVTLFLLVAAGYFIGLTLFLAGWSDGAELFADLLVRGDWAPGRALTVTFGAELSDLGPVALWSAAFLGLCVHWAGRHDRP